MSKKLLLLPPLAFARVGTSNIPVDWILWGPNDAGLDGTTKTTAVKFTSFDQQSMQGDPASDARLVFEDDEGIRPVCPYFELWEVGTGEPEPLLDPQFRDKVTWTIELANLKGFYRTRKEGDKVLASRTVLPAETGQKLEIQGCSPDIGERLVRPNDPIQFGHVEASNADARPYRLRFYAPKGLVYGPQNIGASAPVLKNVKAILNPRAAWCGWKGDERGYVSLSLTAGGNNGSFGLMDDLSDGIITCSLPDGRSASARIAVTPPHYAPDRRYLISVADGLKDREERGNRDDELETEADQLVLDIFERVLEHVEIMNLDALVDRYNAVENPRYAFSFDRPWMPENSSSSQIFEKVKLNEDTHDEFPLTERGKRRHSTFASIDLLKRFVRQRPDLLKEILRPPVGDSRFYDNRMPMLQRGSDARPLHLTRQQYDLVLRWAKSVSE